MRAYLTADVNFYVEQPNIWDLFCRYPPTKSWEKRNLKPYEVIPNYRDIRGQRLQCVKDADLWNMERGPSSRIKSFACLPILYANGARFIKIEQAKPLGFKCAFIPMNLREQKVKQKKLIEEEKKAKKEALFQKRLLEECEKADSGRGGGKGKNRFGGRPGQKECNVIPPSP